MVGHLPSAFIFTHFSTQHTETHTQRHTHQKNPSSSEEALTIECFLKTCSFLTLGYYPEWLFLGERGWQIILEVFDPCFLNVNVQPNHQTSSYHEDSDSTDPVRQEPEIQRFSPTPNETEVFCT